MSLGADVEQPLVPHSRAVDIRDIRCEKAGRELGATNPSDRVLPHL